MTTLPVPTFRDDPSGLMPVERDACAIIAFFNKAGRPTHGNVQRTIEALIKMGHRAGEISGEGDGCGVLTDLPRRIWQEALAGAGLPGELAESPVLAVGHLLVPREALAADPGLQDRILERFRTAGIRVLLERSGTVRSEVLSVMGRQHEPLFWQLALECPDLQQATSHLYRLQLAIELETPVHVASLSTRVAAYKVHGAPELLSRYYPELKRRDFLSAVTIGHSRFSTNTLPTVLRAQPFSLLGHNGEINTIARLREEAHLLGIVLPAGGSDSQDLNRTLEGLIEHYGLTLFEAMELVFPPIFSAMDQLPPPLRSMYTCFRRFLRASAQGPAALIARHLDQCVCSVDAMGLRPLWFGETDKEYFASSEVAVVPQEELLTDPKPLAPGEKLGLRLVPDRRIQILEHGEVQQAAWRQFRRRTNLAAHDRSLVNAPIATGGRHRAARDFGRSSGLGQANLLAALAWKSSDLRNLRDMARKGEEPIASLGYDGPLAALALGRQNLSDYFKEQVAVVTNPAIDREREAEHFSTRVYLGPRTRLRGGSRPAVALEIPLLLGGRRTPPDPGDGLLAERFGTATLESLLAAFGARARLLSCSCGREETVAVALARLQEEAVRAVETGAALLLVDDGRALVPGRHFLDPFLVVAGLHKALKEAAPKAGENLRRRTAIVLRSGALRNLHDLIFALGMGADALCPYLMWELAGEAEAGLERLVPVLAQGLEKIISTMGTHEIGGYGKYFASIGLAPELADLFETPNFCGSARGGLTLERLTADHRERGTQARSRAQLPVPTQFRLYPRIWKMVGAVAKMEESYADLSRLIRQLEADHPLALRHLLDFRFTGELSVDPEEVDTRVGDHNLPILISAMSFGSQGETPFRIYAEAAKRLNIICMNGEGGEIADMLGRYRKNRGQQIASGRFGVSMELLNSADFLEIKVGQGAKPGEGGHLPGFKVTAKIAAARNAVPGVGLISPSNNHDIYSIEDLAQLIEELRTANPQARISVKVPAVAGIGTIAMGIAKAGADIITVSGYDGGTGAARKHAIKFVGLPAEIGVREAHRALLGAGLRHKVEIWADGGARSGRDVVKLMLLGANRVGFGTLAMVIIGCTACRGCHLDTCHVGIATQIETLGEAQRRGLKRFVPRVLENGIIYQTTFFRALGQEIRTLTAKLGFRRAQDLVGRAELLEQARGQDRLDLEELLAPLPPELAERPDSGVRIIRKPLNYLTSLVSILVTGAFDEGEDRVRFDDDNASSSDRAIGTYLAGAMTRARNEGRYGTEKRALLQFRRDSIPGNGLGAFNIEAINIRVNGATQDGVGKCSTGGRIVVLKGENRDGDRVGGSVGKGLAYGAQGGTIYVQGDADSRACIRLSGADVVLGGRLRRPLAETPGNLAAQANLKGFAFEYMTAGRAVVLGDPGPWLCSGMTGGTVYCHLDRDAGLDRAALCRRLARGARVELRELDAGDLAALEELLLGYHRELLHSHQAEEADWVLQVLARGRTDFVKIGPEGHPAQPVVATE
jgi:glutamate synthase (NADPH/NADH) large chain